MLALWMYFWPPHWIIPPATFGGYSPALGIQTQLYTKLPLPSTSWSPVTASNQPWTKV